jgi:hypothetical protein
LAYAGSILALVGGILMVLFGGLGLLGLAFSFLFQSPLQSLSAFGRDVVTIILGIVSIIGSRYVARLEWAIILIIVGYFGGEIGGLLVLVAGILGLIVALSKRR